MASGSHTEGRTDNSDPLPIFVCILAVLCAISAFHCGGTTGTTKPALPSAPPAAEKPRLPDITVQMASLDLSGLRKRVELPDIDTLSQILDRMKIDILSVQGVTRYPDVSTRVDFVDEIAVRSHMRQVFGETITVSGRETGNAVFSIYPAHPAGNTRYQGLRSPAFASALQAVVDCGAREVVIVSTRIPDKASIEDQTTCANQLGSMSILYMNQPMIVAGNLPRSEDLRKMEAFQEAPQSRSEQVPRLWFSKDGSLSLGKSHVERTPLGQMLVAEFGVFRAK